MIGQTDRRLSFNASFFFFFFHFRCADFQLTRSKEERLGAMEDIFSVASFRSTRLEAYRKNLELALEKILRNNCTSALVCRYNVSRLETTLLNSIAWKELSEHHDECKYNPKHSSISTPWNEVVDLFVTRMPSACSEITVKLFLFALLNFSPATRHRSPSTATWSPSQDLLIKAMIIVLNRCPSIETTSLVKNVLAIKQYSTNQLNRFCSIVYVLAQDCSRHRIELTQNMLQLILILDGRLLQSIQQYEDKKISSSQKSQQPLPRPTKRPTKRIKYTLSDLHEEELSGNNAVSNWYSNPNYYNNNITYFSEGKLLNDTISKDHLQDYSLEESSKLAIVLSRAYRKLVRLVTSHHHPLLDMLVTRKRNDNLTTRLTTTTTKSLERTINTYQWMRLIVSHPLSPSLRLGLLFASSCSTLTQNCPPQEICTMYWTYYLSSKNTLWLRFLTELIDTSSSFDDIERCWTVIRPIWEHLLLTSSASPEIFASLAHLLFSRGYDLSQSQKEFLHFRVETSLKYGEAKYWKMALPQFGLTLQHYDILGFVEINGWKEEDQDEVDSQDTNTKELCKWPFEKEYTMRGAYTRITTRLKDSEMLPSEFNDCLSSSQSTKNTTKIKTVSSLVAETRPTKEPSPSMPLLDYLNTDIQYHMLSFFNYKELIQARCVCHSWKTMVDQDDSRSNKLWQCAYQGYFGPWKDSPSITLPWSCLFRNKYLTERSLQFKRNNTTGYKHTTCRHLGCLYILKSQHQQDKHEQKHANDLVKLQRRLQRQEEAKRKKQKRTSKPSGG